MAVLFDRVAVVGVGLIGGSLALAARKAGLIGDTIGVGRSEENLRVALDRGIVRRATTDIDTLEKVDLVVLAVPVASIAPMARRIVPRLSHGAVVTDVASVKASIVRELEPIWPRFVGAHPIAGTERSGAAAADVELFRGSRCILTPTGRTDRDALGRVAELWRGVGATVEEMDPAEHDRALAWTSHLVHAIAFTLARAIGERDPRNFRLAGPSLRDATRVASSSPDLWREILLGNADAVSSAIGEFGAELERFRRAIDARDEQALESLLVLGREFRRALEGGSR